MLKSVQKITSQYIKKAFDSLRLHLIGPDAFPKSITFTVRDFNPLTTVAANYLAANSINSADPNSIDKETVEKLKNMTAHYIDSLEQKSLTEMNHILSANFSNLEIKAKLEGKSIKEILATEAGKEILKNIRNELNDKRDKVNKSVELLVNNELHNAQNFGALDGIIGISKSLGIDDPTVLKIGVLDDNRCAVCWKFWTLSDKKTPKVYKLSELSGSPGHWKNPDPSIAPTHPNCRDVLTFLNPGFGFDSSGKIIYKGIDPETNQPWDEYKNQKKS